jgi:hypothetical protein
MAAMTAIVLVIALMSGVVLASNIFKNPSAETGPSIGNTLVAFNPYDQEGRWHKGQLHCHSYLSDGSMSPDAVVARYAELGYDFVASTDHGIIAYPNGSILVIGSEYGKGSAETSPLPHIGALNISTIPSEDLGVDQRIANILGQGGFAIINHPASSGFLMGDPVWSTIPNYTGVELMSYSDNDYTIAQWDNLLTQGKRIWGVADDDSHDIGSMNVRWVMVRVPGNLTTDKILDALRQGSFYSSQGPTIKDIEVSNNIIKVTSPGADRISFYGSGGKLLYTRTGGEVSYQITGTEGYVRAEVDHAGKKAWTEPVFVKKADSGTIANQSITLELIALPWSTRPLPAA